ncbi:L-type lectin family protein [Pontiella sulfatireligans]|nr:hypothetical protein [Pontiella sulfatireligans]
MKSKKTSNSLGKSLGIWIFFTVASVASSQADVINGGLTLSGEGDSFDYMEEHISTSDGFTIGFDLSTWGPSYMMDGFAIALFDAETAVPAIGGFGGSLGYANRTNIEGLAGGVLGIGFDAHGNYSDDNEDRNGGVDRTINSIALRGSMGDTRYDGYEYIDGTGSLDDFMNNNQADSKADALTHSVRIIVTTNELVSVEWKETGAKEWTTLLDEVDASAQMTLSEEVKLGVTSSRNSAMNIEISNLSVSIPEPAALSMICGMGGVFLIIRRTFIK